MDDVFVWEWNWNRSMQTCVFLWVCVSVLTVLLKAECVSIGSEPCRYGKKHRLRYDVRIEMMSMLHIPDDLVCVCLGARACTSAGFVWPFLDFFGKAFIKSDPAVFDYSPAPPFSAWARRSRRSWHSHVVTSPLRFLDEAWNCSAMGTLPAASASLCFIPVLPLRSLALLSCCR